MNMNHFERSKWCEEISKINKEVGGNKGEKNFTDLV
jgi:hypothetical protein